VSLPGYEEEGKFFLIASTATEKKCGGL